MENREIAVGLDIGTTKIVAMVGEKNQFGKIKVLGVGKSKSLGVQRGVVSNISKTIASIQSAIDEAESTSGHKIEEVVVGIAGQHIRSLHHSDYIIREKSDEVIVQEDVDRLIQQVYKLVLLPGEQIIHVLPQEFKVDAQEEIKDPIGMHGARLEANFHVVVGMISSIKNIIKCIDSAGLKLAGITLEPLASSMAVLNKEEEEAGVALIDIGGGTTDLAIFKNEIIRHTAVIPFGGNIITEDIKEGCSIIEKQAELLKVKFGSVWPAENKDNEIVSIPGLRGRDPKEITLKNLSNIIHARVTEIVEQVYVEIKNYGHENSRSKLIAGIVVTGGGAQVKHLKQLVEYITGMDTRIGYPNEHLAGDSDEALSSPIYSTAVGLVMEALEQKEKEKEFYQEQVEELVQQETEHSDSDEIQEDNEQLDEAQQQLEEEKKFSGRVKSIMNAIYKFIDIQE
jgi:cell division protein FtsA